MPARRAPSLVAASVAALAALAAPVVPAAADSIAIGDAPSPDPDDGLQLEGGIGALLGQQPVGPVIGTAMGFHLDGGIRLGRLAALGEYAFISLTEDAKTHEPAHAFIHRLGATARYSLGMLRTDNQVVRGDFWLEAGLGRQRVAWRDGGALGRTDVSLGFGAQVTFRYGAAKRRRLGLYYAAAFLFSDRADAKALPATCSGPCDRPTHAFPIDVGIYFNLGVPFR